MKGRPDHMYVIYVVVINIFFSCEYIMDPLVSDNQVKM